MHLSSSNKKASFYEAFSFINIFILKYFDTYENYKRKKRPTM